MISHWIFLVAYFQRTPLPARKEKLWNWGLIPRWFWYKKAANLNPPPKKLKKPMQKKKRVFEKQKKPDTYNIILHFSIFSSCFCLVDSKSLACPCPRRRTPVPLDPQPAPVAPGAWRRTGGRPGMWPSAGGRAGASPHCQPRRRCWWCPGPWWGPPAPGMRNGLILGGMFQGYPLVN